jgi:K+-transporting ATPase ATPase C chain
MLKEIKTTCVIFLLLTIITGVLYPLSVTLIAQIAFSHQANGSLIQLDGKNVGSELIGQEFTDSKYFWGRPSATSTNAYNAASSTGSNLGPTNIALFDAIKARIAALEAAHPGETTKIPIDLVTASGSGLDPHISPAAAKYQIARVAKQRHIDIKQVEKLVDSNIETRTLGVLGEPRVNVLKLNLALDQLGATSK